MPQMIHLLQLLNHVRKGGVATGFAILGSVGEESVVFSDRGELQVLDLTVWNPHLNESLLNCTGQAQQTRLAGVFPAELGVELLDKILRHLVLITLNMRADVGTYILGRAARLRHENTSCPGGDAGVRSLPTGMDDGEAPRRRQDHGNAIGKAQHDGNVCRGTNDGICSFGDLGPHAIKLVRTRRANHGDMVTVHLIGHQQPLQSMITPESRKRTSAVLLNARDVVPHMGPQVQRVERPAGNATGTLREPKTHTMVTRRNKRHAITLHTLHIRLFLFFKPQRTRSLTDCPCN